MQWFTDKGGRLMTVFGLATAAWVGGEGLWAQVLPWTRLSEGLAITLWDPGAQCRQMVPPLVLVDIDPERYRFAVFHYRDERLDVPPSLEEWQRRTRATMLFNAGLFRPDYSYMGLLRKDGRSLSGREHPQWKGLFVAEPVVHQAPKARVVDLAAEPIGGALASYREAAQALMLFDRNGNLRVRRSENRAQQTAVAEARDGHVIVIKTTGDVTLWDLAQCLREKRPELHHAMAMDGGSSSDLRMAELSSGGREETEGRATWYPFVKGIAGVHIPLPTVIGVFPREPG
jgi:uncharacterized protein YigE (DUF2233 family)